MYPVRRWEKIQFDPIDARQPLNRRGEAELKRVRRHYPVCAFAASGAHPFMASARTGTPFFSALASSMKTCLADQYLLSPDQPVIRCRQLFSVLPVFVLAGLLAACGGGGGRADAAPATESTAPLPAPTAEASGATASTPPASASMGDTSCGLNAPDGIQAELLSRLNALRASGATCGATAYGPAPALTWNATLLQAATGHARDMASRNYFAHLSQDGRTPPQRLLAAGYSYASMGENIAAGQTSVEQVMNAWVGSPGHCQNMLNPVYRDVAVACVADPAAAYEFYWAMELGRSF